jgi:hypothetical protein
MLCWLAFAEVKVGVRVVLVQFVAYKLCKCVTQICLCRVLLQATWSFLGQLKLQCVMGQRYRDCSVAQLIVSTVHAAVTVSVSTAHAAVTVAGSECQYSTCCSWCLRGSQHGYIFLCWKFRMF